MRMDISCRSLSGDDLRRRKALCKSFQNKSRKKGIVYLSGTNKQQIPLVQIETMIRGDDTTWIVVVGGDYRYKITRASCVKYLRKLMDGKPKRVSCPTELFKDDRFVIERKKHKEDGVQFTGRITVALGDHELFMLRHIDSPRHGYWQIVKENVAHPETSGNPIIKMKGW